MNQLELIKDIHTNAVNKGWWDEHRSWKETRILIASEIAELLEAFRNNEQDKNCDKPIKLTYLEEELADIIIRVLDYIPTLIVYEKYTPPIVYTGTITNNAAINLDTLMANLYSHHETDDKYYFAQKLTYFIGHVVSIANHYNINIWEAIKIKHEYNKTREYKHGKKF